MNRKEVNNLRCQYADPIECVLQLNIFSVRCEGVGMFVGGTYECKESNRRSIGLGRQISIANRVFSRDPGGGHRIETNYAAFLEGIPLA